MSVQSGALVTIETLTQHAFDDYERMIKGDPGAESVFRWTAEGKSVERRGAGPMDGSIFGRGAGEGFGVHICTGPIHVCGAEPGDVLEVRILDIWPRPSANPAFAGKSFGSNAAAWWGFQYNDLIDPPARRETITIFETDARAEWAHALYSYRWTPQTDPFGVRHETMDYPGVPVDHATIEKQQGVLAGVRIPARLHFGFMAVAPRESDIIDSIPPGYFGGNVDNWRATKGTTLYLPVAVPGALFSIGDPHFAQGDGEVNGTALELSLTGQFRFVLHKNGKAAKPHVEGLAHPLLETPEAWILHGFSYGNYLRELGRNAQSEIYQRSSVDLALRNAFRATRKFLMECYRLSEDEALALISLGVDFGVTQVADGNWGVHAIVRKNMFGATDERRDAGEARRRRGFSRCESDRSLGRSGKRPASSFFAGCDMRSRRSCMSFIWRRRSSMLPLSGAGSGTFSVSPPPRCGTNGLNIEKVCWNSSMLRRTCSSRGANGVPLRAPAICLRNFSCSLVSVSIDCSRYFGTTICMLSP